MHASKWKLFIFSELFILRNMVNYRKADRWYSKELKHLNILAKKYLIWLYWQMLALIWAANWDWQCGSTHKHTMHTQCTIVQSLGRPTPFMTGNFQWCASNTYSSLSLASTRASFRSAHVPHIQGRSQRHSDQSD